VSALRRAVQARPGPEVLNVGSGPFFELELLPRDDARFTVCDIDERAVALAREQYGARLHGADVVPAGGRLPYDDGRFDLVVSMDVIEHLHEPGPWLDEIVRVLRPGGMLFLTTPNYGVGSSLALIERTVLEAIARLQGFSRARLHPSKFHRARLADALAATGLRDVVVRPIAFRWVLAATARKPAVT
jgi:SAM-dependent methyltransferase